MGLRETMNNRKGLSSGIAVVITVAALSFLATQFIGSSAAEGIPQKTFYSADDGKTYFVDDVAKLPPFDHDGQKAVRAHLYTCDDGKTTFVGYLSRFTPAALAKLESARNTPEYELVLEEALATGSEVKKPGGGNWVARGTPEAAKVANPSCPDGNGTLKAVF